jgi:hypothetical protein
MGAIWFLPAAFGVVLVMIFFPGIVELIPARGG